MNNLLHFYFLLSLIILFLIQSVNAENDNEKINFAFKKYKKSTNKEVQETEGDKFYMVFVNNTSTNHQKRQTTDSIINTLITDIHNLIVENKDTYEDPSILEVLDEQGSGLLRKRDTDESGLVYQISSIKHKSLLYAYLSPSVVPDVEKMNNVIACEENRGFQFFSHYNKRDIQLETGWKNFTVRSDADLHLSLISQGQFESKIVEKYDKSFYYPDSAGKDIDIFIIDSGFNFDYREFPDSDRIVRCGYNITQGKVLTMASTTNCHVALPDDHGTEVADIAAGLTHGVANKANVYGFVLNEQDTLHEADLIAGLEYIKLNLFRSYKAVINLSLGGFYSISQPNETLDYLQELITEMSNNGAVFVVAAGNEAVDVYSKENDEACYPCAFKDVICVGAVDTVGINGYENPTWNMINVNEMKTKNYVIADFSNYGNFVDIYAPGYAKVEYKTKQNKLLGGIDGGTSVSTPIVAGVAATIMSEHPKKKFTSESMLVYLRKLAEQDIVRGLLPTDNNYFINNGKHTVYSANSVYNGCGLYAGNNMCKDSCCSLDGYCTTDEISCRTDYGVQIKYGYFLVVMSKEIGRCGYGYGACPYGNCCSYDGHCGKSDHYCGVGCQVDYGFCKKEYVLE